MTDTGKTISTPWVAILPIPTKRMKHFPCLLKVKERKTEAARRGKNSRDWPSGFFVRFLSVGDVCPLLLSFSPPLALWPGCLWPSFSFFASRCRHWLEICSYFSFSFSSLSRRLLAMFASCCDQSRVFAGDSPLLPSFSSSRKDFYSHFIGFH